MAFNRELADRAIKAIEANRDEWVQGLWRCDTGMCFAGWVAHMAGATWATNDRCSEDYLMVITPDDRKMAVPAFALEQLGISSATLLFMGDNRLKDLKRFIEVHDRRGD